MERAREREGGGQVRGKEQELSCPAGSPNKAELNERGFLFSDRATITRLASTFTCCSLLPPLATTTTVLHRRASL